LRKREREREGGRERDLIGDATNLLICVLDVLFKCPCVHVCGVYVCGVDVDVCGVHVCGVDVDVCGVHVCDLKHLYVWASICARPSHV